MEKLSAFYFSGTGNTKYITEKLCDKLKERYEIQIFDITAERKIPYHSADMLLFAFPIYGSAPPKPMVDFVCKNVPIIKGKECIIAATQYFFSGDGAASLGRLIRKSGGKVRYAEHFNMPNNLADSTVFKIRNGEEIAEIINKAERKAERFAKRILKGKRSLRGFNLISHAVGYYCQRKWWRKGEADKTRKLQINREKCIGCGLCAKHCPVRNITIKEGKAFALSNCAYCYRCINLCPKRAVSLFGKEVLQNQYKGPYLISTGQKTDKSR